MKTLALFKNARLIIFLATAAVFLVSGGSLRADYQQDKDIEKAAQQLKDADDAKRAADKRQADSKQYGEPKEPSEDSVATKIVLILIATLIGIGVIIYILKS